ncbi:MAG: hypothetical protein U0930_19225 [Pirellulales bacterium]
MRNFNLLLIALAIVVGGANISQAQLTSVSQTKLSASTATLADYDRDYDFDVYARSPIPTTKYFIVYFLSDGSTIEDGPISSYDMATREVFFNFEHDLFPEGTIDVEVEARQVLEPFTKFARYDKYSQASSTAWQLETYGLETDIRWIRMPTLKTTVTSTIRRVK